jgi:hypothetical protein
VKSFVSPTVTQNTGDPAIAVFSIEMRPSAMQSDTDECMSPSINETDMYVKPIVPIIRVPGSA